MNHYYTNERNHQILIYLLKKHNIKKVIASPGTANSVFVGSIQNDSYFEVYSCVDERSAAYMACGLSLESNEPVVISCTGATAARNYMSGATEAFYSKLPILILTSSQPSGRVGHLVTQVTERSSAPHDTCNLSIGLPLVNSSEDEWLCTVNANKALTELRRHGCGPVHLNLITPYSYNESVALTHKELQTARVIKRLEKKDSFPDLKGKKVAIFVGSHKSWDEKLTMYVENFCENCNSLVLCDHTSNYKGKYKILFPLVINQSDLNCKNIPAYSVDILIHIGEISGEEGSPRMIRSNETWRVSEDGEIRDYFRNMTYVFEMSEYEFFEKYQSSKENNISFYEECLRIYESYKAKLPKLTEEMPFSNVWLAQKIAPAIPKGSTVMLSILNTLRTWNYGIFDDSVNVYSPVGGFGIDGATSMLIGASLGNSEKLYFCMSGDLAFFYDLNVLGNRHVGKNVRILLINNGLGFEFKKDYALAYRLLQDEVNPYVAADGHFGCKSKDLVRNFSENLGYKYLCASSKDEFMKQLDTFVNPEISDKPIVFECFVDSKDESIALNLIQNRSN